MKNKAGSAQSAGYHAVRFYDNEKSLAQMVADFLAEGLTDDKPGIVIAAPSQRAAIVRELVTRSFDVVALQVSGDLVLLDADETLSRFMQHDGTLQAVAFGNAMRDVIRKACRGRTDCTVRIYGQMVDILWKDGKQKLAIDLEILWNQLANTQAFSLLCGYAMGSFYKDVDTDEICGRHTHVVSGDGSARAVA
jgi:MEDS: MEthanogen/methylotroph, DcmR Sensory domain